MGDYMCSGFNRMWELDEDTLENVLFLFAKAWSYSGKYGFERGKEAKINELKGVLKL